MSLSTCTKCGGHIPLGPDATNRCETCETYLFGPNSGTGCQEENAVEACEWSTDFDGIWHTACKNAHVFIDGGPVDNTYIYCPYCGKRLAELPYEDDDDEEGEG